MRNNLGYFLALAAVGLFIYAFNLHGPLFWDDADWIVNNFSVHALTWFNLKFIFSHDVLAGIGQVSNYYRPFLFLTFLINYLVSGTDPILYHLLSDAIHVANALLIFYLLTRWFKNRRLAFIASLLFLIQPLQTEAVAYVSGRGDPLSVMFMLAGLALYLNNKKIWTAVVMVLAVLSRETAVLFPIYLGIILFAFEWPLNRANDSREEMRSRGEARPRRLAASSPGEHRERALASELRQAEHAGLGTAGPNGDHWLWFKVVGILKQIWPYLSISAVYGVLRLTVLNFQNTLNFYTQQNIYSEHLSYRLYTFCHALVVYLRLIFWPVGLHMDRDIPVSTSLFQWPTWLGALIILASIVLMAWFLLSAENERQVKSVSRKVWLFGLGIFFVNLLPTSGIVPINARIYEHWLYFSLFGLLTIVAFYIDYLWSWLEKHRNQLVPTLVFALVGYSVFFGIQTIRRNLLWTNVPGMYQNILSYQPDDVRVLNNLGNWDSDHGDNTAAAPLYERAIAVDPSQPAPYYNLGNIYRDQGQPGEAISWYQKSLEADPNFYYAYGNLASEYFSQKKYSEALAELKKLEALYPTPQTEQNISKLEQIIAEN
ncbi:MAG TPA: tetratricopeptide repeat protein [Candidatus Paceibacterota bacterium]|nr:tetratricopeptide repeat protein [Candidatus Paceibacterota bacterium]